jgi:hypothetical protein
MPWSTTGPNALTHHLAREGLQRFALPSDRFYPVNWRSADWIVDPAQSLEALVTPETLAVHLWNECIKFYKDTPAPPATFLEKLQREGR